MTTFYNQQSVGSRAALIIGEEGTYGTVPHSAGFMLLPFVSESLQNNKNSFVSETIRPDRQIPDAVVGNQRCGGDLVLETIPNKPFSVLLAHLLGELDENGTQTSSIGATTVNGFYSHILKGSVELGNGTYEGLSLQKQFKDIDQHLGFRGCRLDSWRLDIPNEGIIRSTFGVLGAIADDPTDNPYDEFPAEVTDDAGLTPLTSFQAAIYEGGTAIAFLRSVNLQVSNNLFGDNFVVGQDVRANLLPGRRNISGTAEFLFIEDPALGLDAIDLYNKFVNNTASSLKLTIAQNAADFASVLAGSGSPTNAWGIEIELPRIKYVGGSPTPTIPNDGPLVMSLPFQALRSAANDTDIIVRIVNKEDDVHIV